MKHTKNHKNHSRRKKRMFNLILWFSRALREPNDIEAEQNDDWREAKRKKKNTSTCREWHKRNDIYILKHISNSLLHFLLPFAFCWRKILIFSRRNKKRHISKNTREMRERERESSKSTNNITKLWASIKRNFAENNIARRSWQERKIARNWFK